MKNNLLVSWIPDPLALIIVPPLEPAAVAASMTSSALPFSTTTVIAQYIASSLLSSISVSVALHPTEPIISLTAVIKAIPWFGLSKLNLVSRASRTDLAVFLLAPIIIISFRISDRPKNSAMELFAVPFANSIVPPVIPDFLAACIILLPFPKFTITQTSSKHAPPVLFTITFQTFFL